MYYKNLSLSQGEIYQMEQFYPGTPANNITVALPISREYSIKNVKDAYEVDEKALGGHIPDSVLLLDDVLSELDSHRQNYLLNNIGEIQTMITCTGLDEFINNRFEIDKIFKVSNGIIESEN